MIERINDFDIVPSLSSLSERLPNDVALSLFGTNVTFVPETLWLMTVFVFGIVVDIVVDDDDEDIDPMLMDMVTTKTMTNCWIGDNG